VKLKPEDIKKTEDLTKLPFLTKDEIQNNYPKGIISPLVDISKCWTPHTSGSSGKPVTVVYDKKAEDFEKACVLRPNLSCGQGFFDKWVVITSPDHIQHKNLNKKWFQRFGLFSQEYISLFEDTTKQISMLEKLNPDVLDGYSSSLYLIAKECKTSANNKIKPKIVYGTSDMLTKEMRTVINSAFDVEIYDQFGSVEMGRTAWECPKHVGYHIDMEAIVMEFIKDNEQVSPGEQGEIVYTNLYNYAMPFIRYQIEDVGIISDERCTCGRGLPLMKIIEGRKDSFIQLSDGKIIPPTIWIILLMQYSIEQYKVIQETIDRITIQIIPMRKFSQEDIEKIKSEVASVIGNETAVNIEIVDYIPREKSGKMKPIVSNLKNDW
jgi:phenylacetate-CoA ligase